MKKQVSPCLHHMPVLIRVCWQMQELVKVGCDVRYLNDSYRAQWAEGHSHTAGETHFSAPL